MKRYTDKEVWNILELRKQERYSFSIWRLTDSGTILGLELFLALNGILLSSNERKVTKQQFSVAGHDDQGYWQHFVVRGQISKQSWMVNSDLIFKNSLSCL
jgi:hypothetical protein